ncbi:MAG: hypothetical protein HC848_02230 [Limnobacter sp.]|nr:hypothetical protein [Limnobacter sp.]
MDARLKKGDVIVLAGVASGGLPLIHAAFFCGAAADARGLKGLFCLAAADLPPVEVRPWFSLSSAME